MLTDHRSLLFVLNPVAMEPSLGPQKVIKFVRWALYLIAINSRIELVPGSSNTCRDIMTRWICEYRKKPAIHGIAPAIWFSEDATPPDCDVFKWPLWADVKAVEKEYADKAPPRATTDNANSLVVKGEACIPYDAVNLKSCSLPFENAGNAGRPGVDPTRYALCNVFIWTDKQADVRTFVSSCQFCLMSKRSDRVQRPLSITLHATKPKTSIHLDYLFMDESDKFVLVVKDVLT